MAEKEVLKETDEWIENLKNLLPSVSSENQEYVQSRIELLERLREQVERVQELEQQNKCYQKAIKECVERMNEGGAGTRSFVYEKLIKVLEDGKE